MAVLSDEKVHSAERIVQLLTRAIGRLDADLTRAMERGGEGMLDGGPAVGTGMGTGRTGVNELLRGALGLEGGVVAGVGVANGSITTPSQPAQKSRSMPSFTVAIILNFP
jgi:hypothetical protein